MSTRKSKSKPKKSTITRLDKLPSDIKSHIYDINYDHISPIFDDYLKKRLNIHIVYYDLIEYDYIAIRKKFKISHKDIINYNNLDDKRNFKNFKKKIKKFIDNIITPLIITYGEILDVLEPLGLSGGYPYDFSFKPNNIHIIETKLNKYIPRLNRFLNILRVQYSSHFDTQASYFINQAITKINKVSKKKIPSVTPYGERHTKTLSRKYTRSNSNSNSNININIKNKKYTRKTRSL